LEGCRKGASPGEKKDKSPDIGARCLLGGKGKHQYGREVRNLKKSIEKKSTKTNLKKKRRGQGGGGRGREGTTGPKG